MAEILPADIIDDPEYWEGVALEQESAEDRCVPMFYMRAVLHTKKSDEEGRPIYFEAPYVKIRIPGNRNNVQDRKVTDADKARWPGKWAAFLKKRETPIDGTPIEDWPFLNVAQVAELKAINIYTIEDIANGGDAMIEKIGRGGRELQKRAKERLTPQAEVETGLRKEISTLTNENKDLKSRLETLEGIVAEYEKPKVEDKDPPPQGKEKTA